MKSPNLLIPILLLGIMYGCNNNPSKVESSVEIKADTSAPNELTNIADSQFQALKNSNQVFFDERIPWADFYSNFYEFDMLRRRNPDVKESKTEFVRFDKAKLIEYLTSLPAAYDSVDVFLGRYRNSASQPSGRAIPEEHKKRITVMFAGKNSAFTFVDPPPPYNVGDPHP